MIKRDFLTFGAPLIEQAEVDELVDSLRSGWLGYRAGDFPNSTWISERTLSLPFSAALTDDDVDRVIAAVKHILN